MIDIGQQAGQYRGRDDMPPVALCQHGREFRIFSKYRTGDRKEEMAFRRHDKNPKLSIHTV
ncbi:hypothetical protein RTE01_09620 [Raoultella terrigena]|nr:hypothetical protein RTE01_09620 [Raoultella terrigena]